MYADGGGGCDGCLNWTGVDEEKSAVEWARNETNVEATDNNGLGNVVRELERVYREVAYPFGAPELGESLFESGKSRADLWAFAAMVGVEFGIDTNNVACDNWRDERVLTSSCVHDNGADCKVVPAHQFRFQSGRADCVNHDETETYKTSATEIQPNPVANGRTTVEFFKDNFGFTGRETVAIFGAHTFGKLHVHTSLFPYTWTSRGTHLFNNDYYKTITGKPRWYFDGANCDALGDAFGNKPETRWLAHTRKMTMRGGPIFWIHQNHVCPRMFTDTGMTDFQRACVEDAGPGQMCKPDPPADSSSPRLPDEPDGNMNSGCEMFRLVTGLDEIALNCEMGLYREFEVDDGVIHGCKGLEHFNESMTEPGPTHSTWSEIPQGNKAQPECPKQRLAEPLGSTPLYEIMEEYAEDQTAWINDFIPTMEKMILNGYPDGLTEAPDHHEHVACDIPTKSTNSICYERSEPFDMEPFMIGNRYEKLEDKVYQINLDTGIYDFGNITGQANQLWRVSVTGNQLINLHDNMPLMVDSNVGWVFDQMGEDFIMMNPVVVRAVDCR